MNTSNTYSGINYLNDGIVNIAAAASLGISAAPTPSASTAASCN